MSDEARRIKQVIVMRHDLEMRHGEQITARYKQSAQAKVIGIQGLSLVGSFKK